MTTRRANYVRERMYVCITTYLRNLLHLHYTVRPRECASSLHTNAPTRRPIDRSRYLDTGIAWIHFIISFQFRLSLPVTRWREITPPLFISDLLSRACLTLTEPRAVPSDLQKRVDIKFVSLSIGKCLA